jgi:hypothetical protein
LRNRNGLSDIPIREECTNKYRLYAVSVLLCTLCIKSYEKNLTTAVRPVVYYHATATARLPAGAALLSAKRYRVFPVY